MKAVYEIDLKLTFVYEIEDFDGLKNDREFAEDVCKMLCDEAVNANGVMTYDIHDSVLNVSKRS